MIIRPIQANWNESKLIISLSITVKKEINPYYDDDVLVYTSIQDKYLQSEKNLAGTVWF